MKKERVAIVGTGIAGMGVAYFLHNHFDITIFESLDYIGGHTNTVTVNEDGKDVFIDTGFMVFNQVTYPNLCRLFAELDAPVMETEMSFSVQHKPSGLEYCGSGIGGLFAQRSNIFNIRYLKMLMSIARFNKESVQDLSNPKYDHYTLYDYIDEKGFGEDMLNRYLIPMSSAVWSTPMDTMLYFPAKSLIRFFYNHGFLGLNTQHQWYTLNGGSKTYREKLIAPFKDKIHINCSVMALNRTENGVIVRLKDGTEQVFDKVILACHANQSLKILGNQATKKEMALLRHFKYQKNIATLHTDEGIMPNIKKVWSSWNYLMQEMPTSKAFSRGQNIATSTIYWMNRLQNVSDKKNYFVSINDPGNIQPEKIIKTIEYEHPLFDLDAVRAQKLLPELNKTKGKVFFAGSYFNYGFHEDAFTSAVDCAKAVLGKNPW